MFKLKVFSLVAVLFGAGALATSSGAAPRPQSGGPVSPGDIVETNVNYQPVTGEVLRSYGNLADLNLGENNVGRYLEVQYMKVVQRAGAGGTSNIGLGDTVRRSNGSIESFFGKRRRCCRDNGSAGTHRCALHYSGLYDTIRNGQSGRKSRVLLAQRRRRNSLCQRWLSRSCRHASPEGHECGMRKENSRLSHGNSCHHRGQCHSRENGCRWKGDTSACAARRVLPVRNWAV